MNDLLYKLACKAYGEIAVDEMLSKEANDSKTERDLKGLGADLGDAMKIDPELGGEMINADAPAIAKLEGHLEDSEDANAANHAGTAAMIAGVPAIAAGAFMASKHPSQGVRSLGKAMAALGVGTTMMGAGAKGAATAIDNGIGGNASLEENMMRTDMDHFNDYEAAKKQASVYREAAETLEKIAGLLDSLPMLPQNVVDNVNDTASTLGNAVAKGAPIAATLTKDTVKGITDRLKDKVNEFNKPQEGLRTIEKDYGSGSPATPYVMPNPSNAHGGMAEHAPASTSHGGMAEGKPIPDAPALDNSVRGQATRALDSASKTVNAAKTKAVALANDPHAQAVAGTGVGALAIGHALGSHSGAKKKEVLDHMVSEAAEDIMNELIKVATCEADVDAYASALAEVIADIMG